MELFNILAGDVAISLFGQTFDVSLNWIGNLIRLLIASVGSVGVGIILFSIILKVIVLPFDVYQRVSMRKQNQKMKDNQEKMEKLQKQYADNKDLYNQKVMEMYKESGFSMFSSCLPMILSMVIFIVAINAFNAYSQYSNIENYNTMVDAYNARIESYCPDLDSENTDITLDNGVLTVKQADENKYIYYTAKYEGENATGDYKAYLASYAGEKLYYIDSAKALANAEIKAFVDGQAEAGVNEYDAVKAYFIGDAQSAVVEVYESTVSPHTSFLWIKNIWVTDASYKNPVLNYSEFSTEISREDFDVNGEELSYKEVPTNAYTEETYNTITAKLTLQKEQANGYFVLIALSIATILLQQIISMRSQKEQQKYSSVDGQGASQQKMMLVIMTGMFAIFSFMYSSSFSIYMIMSNVTSLLSTLIINKIVDVKAKKKEQEALEYKYSGRHARTTAYAKEADKKKDKKK
ncbi:MAG: YidC/Oxa1 family membrane protein insertase [Clostridia bacterium]|nr:YidC/Oxa1 family membrane protein insertase [Clostridia bacterium]